MNWLGGGLGVRMVRELFESNWNCRSVSIFCTLPCFYSYLVLRDIEIRC